MWELSEVKHCYDKAPYKELMYDGMRIVMDIGQEEWKKLDSLVVRMNIERWGIRRACQYLGLI